MHFLQVYFFTKSGLGSAHRWYSVIWLRTPLVFYTPRSVRQFHASSGTARVLLSRALITAASRPFTTAPAQRVFKTTRAAVLARSFLHLLVMSTRWKLSAECGVQYDTSSAYQPAIIKSGITQSHSRYQAYYIIEFII